MKINYEIFDSWWEYFLVAWWGISTPSNEKLFGKKATSDDITNKYENKISLLLKKKKMKRRNSFITHLNYRIQQETERKRIIESKAHSFIGQTGIAVSLLIGALSLGTTQFDDWDILLKLFSWFVFLIIIVNFIFAGLHARNVITLIEGYSYQDYELFIDKSSKIKDQILEKIYICEHNFYLNNVKATYLRFAHWYFKFSFILILIGSLLLPPTIIVFNSNNQNQSTINSQIKNSNVRGELKMDSTNESHFIILNHECPV